MPNPESLTLGWDTVFATRISEVNAQITRVGSSPTTFSQQDTSNGYIGHGKFRPWQITTGGSNAIIYFRIPFYDMKIALTGPPAKYVHFDNLVSGTAIAELSLNFIHEEAAAGSKVLHLKVRSSPPDQNSKAVYVNNVTLDGKMADSITANIIVKTLLGDWLVNHVAEFDHVFASADINRIASKADFQWMQPTYVTYAYSELDGGKDGALGILCMTEGRSPAGNSQQMSSFVFPSDQTSTILISAERVMHKLLLPQMTKVFTNCSQSDFAISKSGKTISNATKNITYHVKSKGKSYKAKVDDLKLTVEVDELQLSVKTKTKLAPGIYCFCRNYCYMGLQLANKPDGTQTIGYYNIRPSESTRWTKTDPGYKADSEILGMMSAMLFVLASVVTDGAVLLVLALIIGLVGGLTEALASTIVAIGKNDAPAIDDLVLNSSAAIKWGDSNDFKLNSVKLNNSLAMGGALH